MREHPLTVTALESHQDDTKKTDEGFHHSQVVYAHVHIAKTAGSEVNGVLAARYERVCGEKGYSYDSHKNNDRADQWKQQHPGELLMSWAGEPDLYTRVPEDVYGGWNRARIPFFIMDEIGYHDCDWISQERPASIWKTVEEEISPLPMELHVPCRYPIVDHLLSMCNFLHLKFRCDIADEEIPAEVDRCLLEVERYDDELFQVGGSLGIQSMKCYNAIPIEAYLDYMGSKLQKRRSVREHVHRETNDVRNKTAECLHTNLALKTKVEDYLITNVPYFGFCQRCVGSKDDLFA